MRGNEIESASPRTNRNGRKIVFADSLEPIGDAGANRNIAAIAIEAPESIS